MSQPLVVINTETIIFILKLTSLLNRNYPLLNKMISLVENGLVNMNYFAQSTNEIIFLYADSRERNRGHSC